MQVPNARHPRGLVHQALAHRLLADSLDHGGEGPPGEAVDQRRPGGVGVDQARRDPDLANARMRQQRVQPAPDQGVAARAALEVDQALDGPARVAAVGVEVGRAVVALDDRDRPAGPEHSQQRPHRRDRVGQVLQDEADEEVVEVGRREREVEDVGPHEGHVVQAGFLDAPASFGQRRL